MRFVGLRLSEALPDESTILHFRHILEKQLSSPRVCLRRSQVTQESRGLRLREGTIVEPPVEAPSSTITGLGRETLRCARPRRGTNITLG